MQSSRRSDRKEVSFPATVTVGGRRIRDVVSNVSPTGLYLQADRHRFRPGDRVQVSFSLPVRGRLVPVTVKGRIARVVRDALHRTKGIGVELLSPPESAIATIEAYLAAKGGFGKDQPSSAETPNGATSSGRGGGAYERQVTEPDLDSRLAREVAGKYEFDDDEDKTDPGDGGPFE